MPSQPRFRLDFVGIYDTTDNVPAHVDVRNITTMYLEFTYTKNRAFPNHERLLQSGLSLRRGHEDLRNDSL
jgi:hypothetical protein